MNCGLFYKLHRKAAQRMAACAAIVLAQMAIFAPNLAFAQGRATAISQISIQTPGSMAKVADMVFGNIAQQSTAGTIVMTASATPTCTVTGSLIRTGVCRAAAFSVVGRKNWLVRIREMNGGAVTLNGPSGATMQLNAFTLSIDNATAVNGGGNVTGSLGRFRIDANSGITNFYIGGTLNVGAAQSVGVYRGTLVIQVQYN
jgi:hypothetical protein